MLGVFFMLNFNKLIAKECYNMKSMKIAALYIRVSTGMQEELSPDAQKRLLIEYAKKNGYIVPKEYIFIEGGISGKKADKRPKFQDMIGLAKSKDKVFDAILVWKYSRFARNQEESILYKSLLKKNDVEVISISEPLIDGPFGTLIERIIEWMDEYYSINLSTEVKRGMTEKALKGGHQSGAPLGYIKKNGVLVIDSQSADLIKDIYAMYLKGITYFAIAQKLNALGVTTKRGNKIENRTVKYILENPIYKGYIRWNPDGHHDLREYKNTENDDIIIRKGEHDPIIDEDTWNEVNTRIRSSYRPKYSKPAESLSHWLNGVLYCSDCGSVLASGGSKGFQCNSYSHGKCSISHYIVYHKAESVVLKSLEEMVGSDYDYEILNTEGQLDESKLLNENLKKLLIKEKRIKEAYINGIDSLEEYKENKQILENERSELQHLITESKKKTKTPETKKIMDERLSSVYSILTSDKHDKVAKNTAIRSIVKKIIYDKKAEHISVFLYYI